MMDPEAYLRIEDFLGVIQSVQMPLRQPYFAELKLQRPNLGQQLEGGVPAKS
jgi:hypothetical protein